MESLKYWPNYKEKYLCALGKEFKDKTEKENTSKTCYILTLKFIVNPSHGQ